MHRTLVRKSVLLAGVARPARGHDVLPRMGTAARAGHHVVEVLGGSPAVLTPTTVASEDVAARQRCHGPVGNAHELHETDHTRNCDRPPLRAQHTAARLENLGLTTQDEYDRPPHRDDRQRLETGIEQQYARHALSPRRRRSSPARPSSDPLGGAAPLEVPNDLVGLRSAVGPVGGFDPEPHVRRIGSRDSRRDPPPVPGHRPETLPDRRDPEPGPDDDCPQDPSVAAAPVGHRRQSSSRRKRSRQERPWSPIAPRRLPPIGRPPERDCTPARPIVRA